MDISKKSYGFSAPQKKPGQNTFRGGNAFQKKHGGGSRHSRFQNSRSSGTKEPGENNFMSSSKKEELKEKKRVEELMSNQANFPTLGGNVKATKKTQTKDKTQTAAEKLKVAVAVSPVKNLSPTKTSPISLTPVWAKKVSVKESETVLPKIMTMSKTSPTTFEATTISRTKRTPQDADHHKYSAWAQYIPMGIYEQYAEEGSSILERYADDLVSDYNIAKDTFYVEPACRHMTFYEFDSFMNHEYNPYIQEEHLSSYTAEDTKKNYDWNSYGVRTRYTYKSSYCDEHYGHDDEYEDEDYEYEEDGYLDESNDLY